ncbi:MAG: DUF1573 domain-containing protein [Bacteroidetes bacterium]|nr:MAG: DUF1573 domain-containing protein [Bacteroidota bacterium]
MENVVHSRISPSPWGQAKLASKALGVGLFFVVLLSCGQEKDKLPADLVGIPATADEGIDKSELAEIIFQEEEFDFGTITQGEKVSHEFKFENTGVKDLIISNAYADCGCTVPEVPKKPIAPGEGSVIRVSFDSDKKSGLVTKSITVVTNCIPNKHVVKIKANIFVPQTKNQ